MRDFRDLPNYVKVAIIILVMLLGILGALLTQPSPDKLETHHYYTYEPVEVYTAKEARDRLMDDLRLKHVQEVYKWIDSINKKVIDETDDGSACTLIDVTAADMEVQEYLVFVYDRAGYYKTELIPGWSTDGLMLKQRKEAEKACQDCVQDSNKKACNDECGHPNGKTYLSLSW